MNIPLTFDDIENQTLAAGWPEDEPQTRVNIGSERLRTVKNDERVEVDGLSENAARQPFCISWKEAREAAKKPIKWVVDGIVAEHSCGFVGAPPKRCKSWLVLDLAVAISSGGQWLGRDVAQGSALYIAGEGGLPFLARRVEMLANARNLHLDDLNLFIRTSPTRLDRVDDISRLRQSIQELKPRIVICDPLTRLHQLKEVTEEVEPLLTELRSVAEETGTALLFCHHSPKGYPGKDFDPLRGAQSFRAWADYIIGLKPIDEAKSLVIYELRDAPPIDSQIMELSTSEIVNSAEIVLSQPESEGKRVNVVLRVLDTIKQAGRAGISTKALCQRANIGGTRVKEVTKLLIQENRVYMAKEGTAQMWHLCTPESVENGRLF